MTHAIHRREDGTIEITVTSPWNEVAKIYNEVIEAIVKETELGGFRKGKAPRALVEEKLDKSKTYEQVIRKLLPKVYNQVITEEKLKPIISPKVELKEAKENTDWVIIIYTCERPNITLGDYKKAIREGKTAKYKKIWVPGSSSAKAMEDKKDSALDDQKDRKPTLDEILSWTVSAITITISTLLLEQEVNRLLSQLIDQTKTLGLSVEQYLNATGKTSEGIRKDYEEQAKRTIALEFGLEEIGDKEGIVISDDDIDAVVKTAKTEEERTSLEKERYYLATVLRRQKTIDFLSGV